MKLMNQTMGKQMDFKTHDEVYRALRAMVVDFFIDTAWACNLYDGEQQKPDDQQFWFKLLDNLAAFDLHTLGTSRVRELIKDKIFVTNGADAAKGYLDLSSKIWSQVETVKEYAYFFERCILMAVYQQNNQLDVPDDIKMTLPEHQKPGVSIITLPVWYRVFLILKFFQSDIHKIKPEMYMRYVSSVSKN